MQVIVVGCGRVGAALALSLDPDHQVAVIDVRAEAFDRLGAHFGGRCVQGSALDREVLVRAGIERVDALAAVTPSDNVNAVVGRIAQALFGVGRVVARVYDPARESIYEKLSLQTVSSSSWGAERIGELLTRAEPRRPASAGRWIWQPAE